MRTWLLAVLAMAALSGCLSGCAIGAPRWTTPGAHVVDGYWLDDETRCPPDGGGGEACSHAVPLARTALMVEEPTAVIVDTWTARATNAWLDAHGEDHLIVSSGVGGAIVIVLDLADGRRRVFGAMCPMGGGLHGRSVCQLSTVAAFPEGAEPWR